MRQFGRHFAVLKAVPILVCLASGCSGGQDRAGELQPVTTEPQPLALATETFFGRWDRRNELDGRRALPLYVDSTTFVFDSVGDTLFRYWYEVRDGVLIFDDKQGGVTRPDVEKLTVDSLVLSNLPFTGQTLRFRSGISL